MIVKDLGLVIDYNNNFLVVSFDGFVFIFDGKKGFIEIKNFVYNKFLNFFEVVDKIRLFCL